jgi:hypothetical protein
MNKNIIKMVNDARWTDGLLVNNRLNEITYDPMRSQEEFVMRLVRENARTAFGQKMGFNTIFSLQEFRKHIPLSSYEDYSDYIERIAKGEKNILTTYHTEHFSLLSGYKKLPVSRWDVQAAYDYQFCSSFYVAGCHGLLADGMTLNLVDNSIDRLPTDITIGNLLGRLLIKRKFDNDQIYVIPVEVANPPEREDINYLQALFAMKQDNVSLAMCEHYSNMLNLLRYIEKHWPRLAEDIENGNPYIAPDPKRAQTIRDIMESHHIGTQLVPLLWPELRCIMVFDVDNLNASFELLRTYCGHSVHFIFTGIGTPEATFSTTINLDDPQTVLIPDAAFYEFNPKNDKNYHYLLTLDQLEIGKSYEIVITNLSGLYRYKTQKIVTVVGRYHDTPTVIIDK